jgi:hypothetical protein
MMADMSGMFGPSPYEVEQQRLAQTKQSAYDFSKMNAAQRGAMGLYQAGSMFGDLGSKALGGVDPSVQNAQMTHEAAKQFDTSTPDGLMQYAAKIKDYDPNRAAQAVMMARKMQAEAAAGALAQQKEARAQQRLEEVDKQKMQNDYEIKMAQLGQTFEIAKMRSEDSRLSSADRLAASREATAARLQLGQLMAEVKRLGVESKGGTGGGKPLTAAQQVKRDKDLAASSAAIRAQDDEIVTLGADIDKAASSEYLGRATGVRGVLPSMPGGKASIIEGELDSIANRLKAQGLKVLREGGGIGAITEKEWDILANQVANIDRKRGPEYVKGELEKVKLRMNGMQRNATQRHYEQFGEEYSPGRDKPPSPTPVTTDRKFKVLGKE